MDNFRDTFVGQLLRLITRNKILQYPDEINPEAYRQAISTDRTLTQAQSLQSWTTTRNTNVLEIGDRSAIRPPTNRHSTTASLFSASSRNTATNTSTPPPEADPDLTKLETQADDTDTKVVTWINNFDPANPQNWSFFKKCATTGQVCLLTFSIYIGSAIYTAGVRDVEQYFDISEVAAVLGLTTFVLGYGTGEYPPYTSTL
jgi:MFS transporter, DHA1 family, multidrug resistance protein